MGTRVLVTGATGFIAGHVIAELLNHGYAVRGTVRSLTDARKRQHLVELAERAGGEIDFAAADLDRDEGWAAAVAGCDYVLHVASPFPSAPPDDEQEMIDTAVNGTLRVLRGGAAAPAGGRGVGGRAGRHGCRGRLRALLDYYVLSDGDRRAGAGGGSRP
ncbi:NAD-dependent epimerase/dehydratase family protein [Nocardia cyriacigeorgica]|uniref:NAD-dependent epimerase/dehydratase family protein n=1 Tax=Nocardia cyriacigeorgica TaxID=135487 RepID=UPI002457A76E|nr:NAD-dependent epimerase/dehydratase family protein [Nocardia cyriacigeorgica]